MTRGAAFLGQSWLANALVAINTANTLADTSGWPWDGYPRSLAGDWSNTAWWDPPPIKGFEWYDTFTTTIISNMTFKGYKYFAYPVQSTSW